MHPHTLFVCLFLILTSCVGPTTKQPIRVPPPEITFLPKTFGDVHVAKGVPFSIQYKSIHIRIDSVFPIGESQKDKAFADYLILTDLQSHHIDLKAQSSLRRDLKIISPVAAKTELTQWGFSKVKGLEEGQRVLLKKEGAYLFVNAVSDGNTPSAMNAYLLEFDNGRNLFVSGEVKSADLFREFLYGLRDDGKEIDIAFLYHRTQRADETSEGEENRMSDIISLLQPKIAVVMPSSKSGKIDINLSSLQNKLKDQLFYGDVYFSKSEDKISF